MRADETRALGRLAGIAAGGGARRVSEMHTAIAGRVFGGLRRGVGPAATPVRRLHDGISDAVYASVTLALRAGGEALGVAAASRTRGGANTVALADHPRGQYLVALLGGAHGDLLERELTELALPMSVRHDGRDVPVETATLAAAYPDATARLAVFLHGLACTEDIWRYRAVRHHGDPTVTYGTLLRRDLGHSPVWIRYNTGRRISANGRDLAELLDRLVDAWPVPVEDLVLVGHSMGGLLARSALAQASEEAADARRWPDLVRDTVTLGSPHLGAPLEQGTGRLTHLLGLLAETRPLARVLAARSVGIKDLRHGNLVEADWRDHHPDALGNTRTVVPLHPGARHFVVLATVGARHDSIAGELVGDLLVRPRSACGEDAGRLRMSFPAEHVYRLPYLHHLDLVNHPAVYAQLRAWLASPPAPPVPPGGSR